MTDMQDIQNTGFTPPVGLAPGGKRGTAAIAALVMIVALTLGTLTAAAVVTIGIARGNSDGASQGRTYAIELADSAPHRG
jgi:hypothetical protein